MGRIPTASLGEGLSALAKSALLLLGVPAALVRLWLTMSPAGQPFSFTGLDASHAAARIAIGLVAAGWLFAGGQLVRDVVAALRHEDATGSSWSKLWALRLAALLLMLGAGAASAATSRSLQAHGTSATATPSRAVTATSYGRLMSTAPESSFLSTVHVWPTEGAAPAPRAHSPLVFELVAALGLGALLSAALARRLLLLRRAAGCTRKPRERQLPPTGRTGRIESLLRPLSDEVLLDWIDGTSRLLWRSLRDADEPITLHVHVVRASPDGIELRLRRPVPEAVEGFVALDNGTWWCLDPNLDLDELQRRTDGCGRFLPGLVPIGEDGNATYLVNVEPGRRLILEGDNGLDEQMLTSIMLACRTLPWADELAIELLGIPSPSPIEQCYQLNTSSPEELAALAESGRVLVGADVTGNRLRQRWARQPMILAGGPRDDELDSLLRRCNTRAGVISLGGDGAERLVLDSDGAWLEPLGIHVSPCLPTAAQLELIEELLAAAASVPSEPLFEPAVADAPAQPRPDRAPLGLLPPGRAEVRLLSGPARLTGIAKDAALERDLSRITEVVAYLSFHGGAADLAELCRAVFGGETTATALERTHNVLGAARRALAGSGEAALLVCSWDDTIRLGPALSCDWHRFAAAVAGARSAAPGHARTLLSQSLELIGPGTCATTIPGYSWLIAEGHQQDMLATIVDAAHHLAQLALAEHDSALARFAIKRGAMAEPHAEMLARDLMLACDLEGDTEGTRRAFAALEEGLSGLCGNEPSLETRELYDALARPI